MRILWRLLFFFLLLKLWCSISLLHSTVMLKYCENYLKSCLSFHILHSVLKSIKKSHSTTLRLVSTARHFWYFSKTVLSCFVARLLGFLKSVWMITQEPTKKLKNGLLPSRYAWHFPQNFCKQHHPKASHKQESVVVGRQFQYKILLLTSFFAFGLDVVVGLHA